jgi:hypothetical protein
MRTHKEAEMNYEHPFGGDVRDRVDPARTMSYAAAKELLESCKSVGRWLRIAHENSSDVRVAQLHKQAAEVLEDAIANAGVTRSWLA